MLKEYSVIISQWYFSHVLHIGITAALVSIVFIIIYVAIEDGKN